MLLMIVKVMVWFVRSMRTLARVWVQMLDKCLLQHVIIYYPKFVYNITKHNLRVYSQLALLFPGSSVVLTMLGGAVQTN